MKKKLNIDVITNELEGASLFFTKPATPVTKSAPAAESLPNPETLNEANTSPTPLPAKVELFSNKMKEAQIPEIRDQKRTSERSIERTDERMNETNKAKTKRSIIRHSFDIFEDQLQALQILQFQAVQKGKKKPKLGKMVQQAIDLYLSKLASKS